MQNLPYDPDEIISLRRGARCSVAQICAKIGVSLSTWKRYECSGRLPRCVYLLLSILASGVVLADDKQWHGWHFHSGRFWSPEDEDFTAGDLRALRVYRDGFYTLKRENERLREKLQTLEQAPHPPAYRVQFDANRQPQNYAARQPFYHVTWSHPRTGKSALPGNHYRPAILEARKH